jgi:hypothetical protein
MNCTSAVATPRSHYLRAGSSRSCALTRVATSRAFTRPFSAINVCHARAITSSCASNSRHMQPRAVAALAGKRRLIMKTIVSALLALTVLTGVAVAPASAAWDTKAFWDNLERTQGGGGN